MRTLASYIRVIIFLTIAALLLMYLGAPNNPVSAFAETWFWVVMTVLGLLMIIAEVCVGALQQVLHRSLKPDALQRRLERQELEKAQQFAGIKRYYKKLLGSKPIEKEGEIILDHNYDGIKELDNSLPPWWVYMFYATIIFAAVYLVRFEIFKDYNQAQEYEEAVAEAEIAIAEYKRTAKNLVDVNTVEVLTDAGDLAAGKTIFTQNCVACHKADGGGGIGPNLTDEYWILGGGIKNVFNTISEGGRDGKGMVSWKAELKPLEMAQVASYLLTFQGTTPAEPKEAEGEIWVDPDAPLIDEMEGLLEEVDSVQMLLDEGN